MTLKRLKFVWICLFAVVFLTGCKASLYDLNVADSSRLAANFLVYENEDLGMSFKYPDYYGQPAIAKYEGKEGESVVLSFVIDYLPDDPILVYVAGTTADFVMNSQFERMFYKGSLEVSEFCKKRKDVFDFVQYSGDECRLYKFNQNTDQVANFSMAFVDAISNSVESVFIANNPNEDSKFTGLQFGFRLPTSLVQFSVFDSAEKRGDKAVQRLLANLDELQIESKVREELLRFKVLVESVE
jgi:hypothetical protein